MKILVKLVITAAAVWVATLLIPGIQLHAHSTTHKILTLVVVALIFGIINAVLKPIAHAIGSGLPTVGNTLVGRKPPQLPSRWSRIRLSTQPTTPTIRAPSRAGTKPVMWNGTLSLPAT